MTRATFVSIAPIRKMERGGENEIKEKIRGSYK
jgi:hypothetical protein